jgi:hypothetical protein
MIESLKDNIEILNKKIAVAEQDKNNILKVKDQQIDLLNKEVTKKINVNLLKAVVMQFLTTNDGSVCIIILLLLKIRYKKVYFL